MLLISVDVLLLLLFSLFFSIFIVSVITMLLSVWRNKALYIYLNPFSCRSPTRHTGRTRRRTDEPTDGRADGRTSRRTDTPTDGRADGRTSRRTDERTNGHADGRTSRRTDEPTDGHADGRTRTSRRLVKATIQRLQLRLSATRNVQVVKLN